MADIYLSSHGRASSPYSMNKSKGKTLGNNIGEICVKSGDEDIFLASYLWGTLGEMESSKDHKTPSCDGQHSRHVTI